MYNYNINVTSSNTIENFKLSFLHGIFLLGHNFLLNLKLHRGKNISKSLLFNVYSMFCLKMSKLVILEINVKIVIFSLK